MLCGIAETESASGRIWPAGRKRTADVFPSSTLPSCSVCCHRPAANRERGWAGWDASVPAGRVGHHRPGPCRGHDRPAPSRTARDRSRGTGAGGTLFGFRAPPAPASAPRLRDPPCYAKPVRHAPLRPRLRDPTPSDRLTDGTRSSTSQQHTTEASAAEDDEIKPAAGVRGHLTKRYARVATAARGTAHADRNVRPCGEWRETFARRCLVRRWVSGRSWPFPWKRFAVPSPARPRPRPRRRRWR